MSDEFMIGSVVVDVQYVLPKSPHKHLYVRVEKKTLARVGL